MIALPTGTPAPRPKTVVIADDSVVARGLFARWLGESEQFHVVGVASDGEAAIEQAARHRPDILVLDLEMPGTDGLTALPRIVATSARTAVVIATTLTERNAGLALQCMTLGAIDVISKPDSRNGMLLSLDFRNEFVTRLAAVASDSTRLHVEPWQPAAPPEARHGDLQSVVSLVPRYLLIGASTGGPRAVTRVLREMGPALRDLTTLVVQHMPPLFTASFAEQLSEQIGLPAREPCDGERLARGMIYIAPGGRHLGITRRLGHLVAAVSDSAPVHFCRPAVDVLFNDAARHLGPAAIGLVLTGMGSDGTEGAGALRRSGAAVVAQDEMSSTIWGMPGSVVRARHASAVLPLADIGPALRNLVRGAQAQ